MSLSPQSPLTRRFDPSELLSEPASSDDWPTAIQLEDTIDVTPAHTSPELRGLLKPMSVGRVDEHTLDVYDGIDEHRVDISSATCSCNTDHNGYCQHVWHILHRAHRGLIPSVVDVPPEYVTEVTAPHTSSEEGADDRHAVRCDECGETITFTEEPIEKAHTTVCANCLLTTTPVKHFYQSPDDEPVLVFLDHTIDTETVESFYPRDSAVSLYTFFTDDPRVTESDTPVAVRKLQYNTDPQEAFQFEHSLTFVPESTLTTPAARAPRSSLWTKTPSASDAIRNPSIS